MHELLLTSKLLMEVDNNDTRPPLAMSHTRLCSVLLIASTIKRMYTRRHIVSTLIEVNHQGELIRIRGESSGVNNSNTRTMRAM